MKEYQKLGVKPNRDAVFYLPSINFSTAQLLTQVQRHHQALLGPETTEHSLFPQSEQDHLSTDTKNHRPRWKKYPAGTLVLKKCIQQNYRKFWCLWLAGKCRDLERLGILSYATNYPKKADFDRSCSWLWILTSVCWWLMTSGKTSQQAPMLREKAILNISHSN